MKVEIAPNTTTELKPIPYNNNEEINLPVDEGDLIKAKYDKGKFLADVIKTDDKKQEEEHTYRHKKVKNKNEKNTYSDFMLKWNGDDIEKVNEERRYLINNRPTHKADFRDKVWTAANKEVDTNGTFVRDANVEDIKIYEGEPWDAGHKHGKEYRDLVDFYIDGFITWDEFLEEYHNEDNYQVEDVHENRSHKHEKK